MYTIQIEEIDGKKIEKEKFLIKKYESRTPAYIDSVKFLAVTASSSDKRLPEETKKVSITFRIEVNEGSFVFLLNYCFVTTKI